MKYWFNDSSYLRNSKGSDSIDNENASLKKFQTVKKGKSIKLIPHNNEMEAQIYDANRVQIQGVLASVVRTYYD